MTPHSDIRPACWCSCCTDVAAWAASAEHARVSQLLTECTRWTGIVAAGTAGTGCEGEELLDTKLHHIWVLTRLADVEQVQSWRRCSAFCCSWGASPWPSPCRWTACSRASGTSVPTWHCSASCCPSREPTPPALLSWPGLARCPCIDLGQSAAIADAEHALDFVGHITSFSHSCATPWSTAMLCWGILSVHQHSEQDMHLLQA